MNCPKCQSPNVSGLVAAFWTPLDEDGEANLSQLNVASESEVGPERLCQDCEHEFEAE